MNIQRHAPVRVTKGMRQASIPWRALNSAYRQTPRSCSLVRDTPAFHVPVGRGNRRYVLAQDTIAVPPLPSASQRRAAPPCEHSQRRGSRLGEPASPQCSPKGSAASAHARQAWRVASGLCERGTVSAGFLECGSRTGVLGGLNDRGGSGGFRLSISHLSFPNRLQSRPPIRE